MRARRREQIEADIGRRGAMRDDRRGIFLEIIRRKIVIVRRNEGLEEPPGPSRDQPQGANVRRGRRVSPLRPKAGSPTGRLRERRSKGCANGTARSHVRFPESQGDDRRRQADQHRARHPAIVSGRRRFRPIVACAAGVHSRRLRRVINSRNRVRAMASPISHAWCARKVIINSDCSRARRKSDVTVLK